LNLASAESAVVGVDLTLRQRIRDPLRVTLESASGIFADEVHAALAGLVLLARVFVRLPYESLPPAERTFAERLAERDRQSLTAESPVLVLLGSRGSVPEWNDRMRSKQHLALPLGSPSSAASFPMIAALLRDLGAGAGALARGADPVDEGSATRTFHVFDARTSIDPEGRLKIPDRDFVNQYDIRTVLGAGGAVEGVLFAMILFARQHVTRTAAEQFVPLADRFRSLATDAARRGRFFEPRG
jgi:hypothetical protein